jgi:hypothetical protein
VGRHGPGNAIAPAQQAAHLQQAQALLGGLHPSAIKVSPKERDRPITPSTMAMSPMSLIMPITKLRSIFSVSAGSWRR